MRGARAPRGAQPQESRDEPPPKTRREACAKLLRAHERTATVLARPQHAAMTEKRTPPAPSEPESTRAPAPRDADLAQPGASTPETSELGTPRARWRAAGMRLAYWTPVLVPMVLFAQIAFLGLRPALCEKRRLAEAEVELRARHARDERLAADVAAHWRARHDPVFVERQRRLRELPPQAAASATPP